MAATTQTVRAARARLPVRLRDIRWSTWWGVLRRSVTGFVADNCADWAAALTYYGVLALFPSTITIAEGDKTVEVVTGLARELGAGPVVASPRFTDVINEVVNQRSSARVLLGTGLLAALWSTSGYVGAFTRASNAIYEVTEGRPFYKLRPLQLGLSAVAMILLAVVAVGLIVSGPVTDAVANALHLGDAPRTVWTVTKWPLLVVVLMLLLSLLFWIAPNVRQPRFRWLTVGGAVALVAWALASFGFGLYVANFGSYDVTYGSLGAIIAFLVWLYLSNCALMFGVEINSEVQRGRERQAGVPDPEEPVLPPKSPPE